MQFEKTHTYREIIMCREISDAEKKLILKSARKAWGLIHLGRVKINFLEFQNFHLLHSIDLYDKS